MAKVYYFAYGPNIFTPRLESKLGSRVKLVMSYVLGGYELTFNCGDADNAYANIVSNEDGFVEGILYELTHKQMSDLDKLEKVPDLYVKKYMVLNDNVIMYFHHSINAEYFTTKKPNLWYLMTMLHGCKLNHLDDTAESLRMYISVRTNGKLGNYKSLKNNDHEQEARNVIGRIRDTQTRIS